MFASRFLVVLTVVAATVLGLVSPAAAATPIDERWAADDGIRTLCGDPIAGETSVSGGSLRHFEGCTLYYSPATGVHEAHGTIRDIYRNEGGLQELGFPVADQRTVWVRFDSNVIGYAGDFQHGTIAWSAQYGAHVMSPSMATEWNGQTANLLMPVADVQDVPGGSRLRFDDGTIYASTAGTVTLYEELHGYAMKIPKKWGAKGGAWSPLGLPVSELEELDGGYRQLFANNAAIYWEGDYELGTARPEAYVVQGAILDRYESEGGSDVLGFPYSDQTSTPTGQIAHFEHADISWNSSTNTTTVTPH